MSASTGFQARASGVPSSAGELLARQYEQMLTIRRLEETLLALFAEGRLAGTTHTCIGQEADAVGVVGNLDPARDVVFSNHRCHGHYLAFTDDLYGLLSEVMGKATGVCGGKGGSQHLCKGNFYSNGVQGSIVPVATGIALAMAKGGQDGLTTVFLGDGTMGQGTVYECLNLASLWRLPLLFVVENNYYAQSTPSALTVAGEIADRARPFGVEATELSTTDVTEIHAAGKRVVEAVRAARAPHFLVLNTYRLAPHSKGDDHRDPAEIEAHRRFDPLTVAAAKLPAERRRAVEQAVERRLAETLEAAEAAPLPAAAV